QGVEDGGSLPDEDAAVPEVFAGADVLLGGLGVGLLLELPDAEDADALALGELGPAVDVAVAGGGEGGDDAEGDQGVRVLLGDLGGDVGGAAELLHRLDDVVGGGDQHDRVGVVPGDQGGAQADARRRVAPARLADDVVGGQLGQLRRGFVGVR